MNDSTHNFVPPVPKGNPREKVQINDGTHYFDPHHKKDPKGVIDKLHILDRIVDRNESMLMSSGAPMTLWKYFPYGPECGCKGDDRRCALCFGSGYLNGYQKYGYITYTYGSQSVGRIDKYGLNLTNIVDVPIPYMDAQAFELASGTTGYLETNWIPISNVLEHTWVKSKIFTPEGSSVTYSFTTDGVNYTAVYNLQDPLDVPEGETQIKIRVTLSRESSDEQSPAVNLFKYRTRIFRTFEEKYKSYHSDALYDKRPVIGVPAFLASKQVVNRQLAMTQEGRTVTYPPQFWALPDVKISERDIGVFLRGNHKDERFEFQELTISEHGDDSRVLHTKWQSRFIFATDDVLGNLYNLD